MTDTTANAQPDVPYNTVWQRDAFGGGRWIMPEPVPKLVRLSKADVNRIAYAVVRLLKAEGLTLGEAVR